MLNVSCAIIIKDNKVLLALRSNTMSNPNKWEFPGGKLKGNETAWESLKREIAEELNLDIRLTVALKTHIFDYPEFTICLYPFVCTAKGDMILLEHKEANYYTLKEMEEKTLSCADIGVLELYKQWLKT